jgi:hypothetical protein
MYRHLASALTGCYLFTIFLVWLAGWGPLLIEGLSPLGFWWCGATVLVGTAALIAAPWVRELADMASVVCVQIGLLGTVVGFMIALDANGAEIVEMAGLYTALATTAVGSGLGGILFVQHWLLER